MRDSATRLQPLAMKLSILDQSPVTSGMTAPEALANSVDLVQRAEALGYERYWVSEHHNDHAFAHAAPEVLIARLASATTRIRLGSGGVLLGHYSPYKVAEQFNLLEALFPGRIDLGIGRAGGGEGQSTSALRPGAGGGPDHWQRIDHLLAWLGEGRPDDRPFTDAHARPLTPAPPEVWVLGTSPASAKFAGSRGLPYAFGAFIDARAMVESFMAYHRSFRPSPYLAEPHTNLTWFALAADTEARARELARSAEVWFVRTFLRGGVSAFPTDEEAAAEVISPMEATLLEMRRQSTSVGTGQQVAESLRQIRESLQVDEISVVTLTASHADRVRSYELIAEASG